MKQEIMARVHFDSDYLQIIVRKVVFKEDGRVDKKYGLSKEGSWIEVPEKTMYPCECYLPIAFWDKRDSRAVQVIVESLQKEENLRAMSEELNKKEGINMAEEMRRRHKN